MIFSFLMLISANQVATDFWEPDALLNQEQYTLIDRIDTGRITTSFTRLSDNAVITVQWVPLDGKPHALYGFSESSASRQTEPPLDGASIGTGFRKISKSGQLDVSSTTDYEFVTLSVRSALEQEPRPGKRYRQSTPFDFSPEVSFWESQLKEAIGKVAARRLTPAEPYLNLGEDYESMTSSGSNIRYVRLTDIASRLSYELVTDQATWNIKLLQPGKPTFRFAPGANAYMKDSTSIPLTDTTMLRDGGIWVDSAVLSELSK